MGAFVTLTIYRLLPMYMPWMSFVSQQSEQIQNHGRCNVCTQHVISLASAIYRLYKLINILKESTYYENNYVQRIRSSIK
jgi:hypothetical protein